MDWEQLFVSTHNTSTHSANEFQVSTSMLDLCFDIFGIAKEKKDARKIKGNRGNAIILA